MIATSTSRWAMLWVCGASACAVGHGRFTPGLPAPTKDGVAIVVLGGAGAKGPAEPATRKAMLAVLDAARTDGREAIVLLPGDFAPHRFAPDAGRRSKRTTAAPLVDAAISATPRPGTRFALRGVAERHHARGPISTTDLAVVRVRADGRGETISQCDAKACTLATDAEPGLVDLVLVDLEPWRVPGPDDAGLPRITSLLDAVAALGPDTPRVLVLSRPIEGAFETGLGAQFGTAATFHLLPAVLQRHLASGVFVGVVAGGERSMHLSADLTQAIQRSDRVWLRAPVWQLVSGNANNPAHGRVARRSLWRGGIVLRPERSNFLPGFAVVRVDGSTTVTIDLVAQRRGRWETARATLPLAPAPAPPVAPTGPLSPCLRCDDKPAGERP